MNSFCEPPLTWNKGRGRREQLTLSNVGFGNVQLRELVSAQTHIHTHTHTHTLASNFLTRTFWYLHQLQYGDCTSDAFTPAVLGSPQLRSFCDAIVCNCASPTLGHRSWKTVIIFVTTSRVMLFAQVSQFRIRSPLGFQQPQWCHCLQGLLYIADFKTTQQYLFSVLPTSL